MSFFNYLKYLKNILEGYHNFFLLLLRLKDFYQMKKKKKSDQNQL